MSEKLCRFPDPNFDAHCILEENHNGGHMMATPEARIKISQGLPKHLHPHQPRSHESWRQSHRGEAPMPLQRPTTDWMKP